MLTSITQKNSSDDYQPQKDNSRKFIIFAVFAFFIGFGLCVIYYSCTFIDLFTLSKIFAGFAVVGFLIPLKYYQKWFSFIKYESVIFNVMGMAPFLTSLFLLLNFTFSSNPQTHQYKIEKISFEGDEGYKSMKLVLENNVFADELKIVGLAAISPSDFFGKQFLKVTLSKGFFGYDVIKEKVFIE